MADIDPPKSSKKFIVAQDGSGNYSNIQFALNRAGPNSRIIIRPGTYEGFQLQRLVEVIGDGPADEIIVGLNSEEPYIPIGGWYSAPFPSIISYTPNAVVRGVTIAGGVCIREGHLLLEHCTISSNHYTFGILIGGGTSRATVRKCKIHHIRGDGISIHEFGQASVEDSHIVENSGSGIVVTGKGSVLVQNSWVKHNGGYGIYAKDPGKPAVVENCEFESNELGDYNEELAVSLGLQRKKRKGKRPGVITAPRSSAEPRSDLKLMLGKNYAITASIIILAVFMTIFILLAQGGNMSSTTDNIIRALLAVSGGLITFGLSAAFLPGLFPQKKGTPLSNILSYGTAFLLSALFALWLGTSATADVFLEKITTGYSSVLGTFLSLLFGSIGLYLFYKRIKSFFIP